jgi:small ligand-binding sensory domain FIST
VRWASSISRAPVLGRAIIDASEQALSTLGTAPDLAIAFVSSLYGEEARSFPELLPAPLRECTLIGCAAAGVIGAGEECEDEPALSLTLASLPGVSLSARHFEHAALPSAHIRTAGLNASLGIQPGSDGGTHFLVLADPFTFQPEPLLQLLDRHYPQATKIGGLASGGRAAGETTLYTGGAVHASGAVCLAMSGDADVRAIVAQGCRPVGQPLFVTRAHGNLLLELDGQRPTDVLRDLYAMAGERDRQLLPHALFLGLVMHPGQSRYGHGDYLVRNLLGVDEETGALWIGAEIEANQVVQFHVRDAVTSAEDVEHALASIDGTAGEPAGALLFSCVGRGKHLYGRPDHDTETFKRHARATPLGGFFCNGEIGPVRGRTFVHGYTSAFALFQPHRVGHVSVT